MLTVGQAFACLYSAFVRFKLRRLTLKRLWILLVALFALGLAPAIVSAQSVTPESLAQYLPANTEFFIGLRTDEGVIDEIDAVVNNIVGKVPPALAGALPPRIGLRATLEQ